MNRIAMASCPAGGSEDHLTAVFKACSSAPSAGFPQVPFSHASCLLVRALMPHFRAGIRSLWEARQNRASVAS